MQTVARDDVPRAPRPHSPPRGVPHRKKSRRKQPLLAQRQHERGTVGLARPLHAAARGTRLQICKMLVVSGAEVDARGEAARPPSTSPPWAAGSRSWNFPSRSAPVSICATVRKRKWLTRCGWMQSFMRRRRSARKLERECDVYTTFRATFC